MTRGRKITVLVLAVVGILTTPVVWLLDSPDTGDLAGASIQAAAGIVALVWTLFQGVGGSSNDVASHTGEARATSGGAANTGVRRPGGRGGGSADASRTGTATASDGGTANSGISYD